MSKDIDRDGASTGIAAEIHTAFQDIDVLRLDVGVAPGNMEFWGDVLIFEEHGGETGNWVVCR